MRKKRIYYILKNIFTSLKIVTGRNLKDSFKMQNLDQLFTLIYFFPAALHLRMNMAFTRSFLISPSYISHSPPWVCLPLLPRSLHSIERFLILITTSLPRRRMIHGLVCSSGTLEKGVEFPALSQTLCLTSDKSVVHFLI